MVISHLLFTDDTLVFCKHSEEQMVFLSWILLCFEVLFSLRVNMEKTALLLVGEVENIDQLACELRCRIGTLPSTSSFRLALDRIQLVFGKRLRKNSEEDLPLGRRQYISKGGRFTLIRSTLSNLPIYLLSLFRSPKSFKCRLEKIQRDFLWRV